MGALVPQGGSQYSDEQRREAVLQYHLLGNMQAVSDAVGIPRQTLADWRDKSEWWQEVAGEIRAETDAEVSATYRELVQKGAETALEKLPTATAAQAMTVSAIAFDKLRLAENKPTRITANLDAMSGLADAFERVASRYAGKVVSEQ